jgi:putative ABC transport system permease protein
MVKHFFISIFRNFLHNKVFTFINLTNLIIGFAVFILFSVLVSYELSYDKFNTKYKNIYRVQTRQEDSNPINFCTFSPAAYRYHLLANVPEVDKVLLMREVSGGQASGQFFTLPDGGQLYDKNGYWSENSIFDIFTIKFKEGDKNQALTEPNTIAISESLMNKIFPQGKALGKKLTIGKRYSLTVSAVYSDFPLNASMRPSYLVSMPTFDLLGGRPGFRDDWTYIDWDNYVLLKNGTDPKMVDAKIKDAYKNVKNFEKSRPYLHPLSLHHISPNSQPDMLIGISILSLAAILILILSCINYVNLSLANSTQRSCEIGIKKVIGLSKKLIARQFLSETLLVTFLATIVGMFVAQASFPLMDRMLGKSHNFSLWNNTPLLLIIFLVNVLVGILSGLYPSLVISAFNPIKVLKGKLFSSTVKSFDIKKVLVVAQFSISLFMLIVSFFLYSHVNFILNKNLGFDSKNTLFSEINVKNNIPFETIKTRLLQHPEIVEVTYSGTIPFMGNFGGYVEWEDAMPGQREMVSRNYVNYDFIPTYNLKLILGRNFSKDHPTDNQTCIINETALKNFGWKEPIGKIVYLNGKSFPVIGVVKDFHPFSVHNPIPTYIMFLNDNVLSGSNVITARVAQGNIQKAKQLIKTELETILPNDPFEFKDFQVLFNRDGAVSFWRSMKSMFLFFAIVSLIISSIGLFGLMLFTIKRRTKEIGIHKILGGSINSVFWKLTYEVIGLLGFAIVLSCPAAVYIYKTMPGAYKEPLNAIEFLAPIFLVAFVAFLTIGYHILKIARSNPVEALRYE